MKMKEANPHVPRLLLILSMLCALAGFMLYETNGTNKLSPDLNTVCQIGLGCCAGLCLLNLVWEAVSKRLSLLLAYAQYLAGLLGFAEYIVSQLNYIANVLYGVDGNSFTPVMMATAGTGLIAFLLALTAAIMLRREAYRKNLAAVQEV